MLISLFVFCLVSLWGGTEHVPPQLRGGGRFERAGAGRRARESVSSRHIAGTDAGGSCTAACGPTAATVRRGKQFGRRRSGYRGQSQEEEEDHAK